MENLVDWVSDSLVVFLSAKGWRPQGFLFPISSPNVSHLTSGPGSTWLLMSPKSVCITVNFQPPFSFGSIIAALWPTPASLLKASLSFSGTIKHRQLFQHPESANHSVSHCLMVQWTFAFFDSETNSVRTSYTHTYHIHLSIRGLEKLLSHMSSLGCPEREVAREGVFLVLIISFSDFLLKDQQ